jgi:uncharacterized protein YaiE (UPF0345 family)
MKFDNVSVIHKANVYFDGKVTSRTVLFPDGSKKTLGVMLPGEYTFSTDAKERMEILQGSLDVLLPGDNEWKKVQAGEDFYVSGNSKFSLKIHSVTDYICSFL